MGVATVCSLVGAVFLIGLFQDGGVTGPAPVIAKRHAGTQLPTKEPPKGSRAQRPMPPNTEISAQPPADAPPPSATTPEHADEPPAPAPPEEAPNLGAASISQQQARSLQVEQLAIARRVMKDFPNSVDALVVLGSVHNSRGDFAETLKCWQQCVQLDSSRADIYNQMGRLSLHTEKYDEALRFWKKALEIYPEMPDVHRQMGRALLNLGKTAEAVAALERSITIAPNVSKTHYLLGQAWFQRRDFAKAKQQYEAALKLQPNHTLACYGLVKTCVRLGRKDDAATYAKMFQQRKAADVQSNRDMRSQYDDLTRLREKSTDRSSVCRHEEHRGRRGRLQEDAGPRPDRRRRLSHVGSAVLEHKPASPSRPSPGGHRREASTSSRQLLRLRLGMR